MNYYGSIDLTRVPKECYREVTLKNGEKHIFLNLGLFQRKEPVTFGTTTYTHFLSCAPKKEDRKEGVNYIVGDFAESKPNPVAPVTADEVAAAPVAEHLPF